MQLCIFLTSTISLVTQYSILLQMWNE